MTASRAALTGSVALLAGCIGLAIAAAVPSTGVAVVLWIGVFCAAAAASGMLAPALSAGSLVRCPVRSRYPSRSCSGWRHCWPLSHYSVPAPISG